jgi:aminoglycoside phosphotransferase (APT) family kinase protein
VLGPVVGLDVPMPVADGAPTAAYPWPWSVVRWVDGDADGGASLAAVDAPRLAEALRDLHVEAPPEAPSNPFRGVPLATRADVVEERLARLKLRELEAPWRAALAAAESTERRWLHGDLHARNVVLRGGRLVGLIDWGDLCAGDTASDLACAWTLFDAPEARAAFWEAYGADPATRARARGWGIRRNSVCRDIPRHTCW